VSATTHRPDAGPVAAYVTLDGAERAVTHLVGLGFAETDVGIAPRNFAVVDPHPLRCDLRRGVERGGVIGMVALAAVVLVQEIGAGALVKSVLPTAAAGAMAGALFGLIVAVVIHRNRRAGAMLSAPEPVAPTRFEIVVERDRDRARHGLAKWWDPAAPPAGSQQPA
jgi:hypothetical protein